MVWIQLGVVGFHSLAGRRQGDGMDNLHLDVWVLNDYTPLHVLAVLVLGAGSF